MRVERPAPIEGHPAACDLDVHPAEPPMAGSTRRNQAHAFFGHHAIGSVSGREDEGPGSTEFIDNRVDLAVATAFRNTDRLKIGPPFPPWAQRWAFTWLESNAACSGGSQGAATHSNIFCQMPLSLQRANRL